ncbi:MAG: bifunctional enoyl-CoA hydratase/phosphate acetyltransferase [Alphaproteobacteria bacterium]
MNDHPNPHPVFKALIERAQGYAPLKVAVVHPCDSTSLESVMSAKAAGLIDPILVGPELKIHAAAKEAKIDLSGFVFEATPHSHAAAARAVELVRSGRVEALMKGSLHTDELMGAVVDSKLGLRTERRISHCFVMATHGHNEPLIVTDAAINIAPTLAEKADIVQNAIDLAHAIGIDEVRVALLSATETVNPAIPSTIEAAALCKMADRGQITGATLDGPLALDNAIDMGAVRQKHIVSPVAGRANVLVVPDLISGNILAKTLSFMAHAEAAGIAVGARVPIILTSRADSGAARIASCAVASLVARKRAP